MQMYDEKIEKAQTSGHIRRKINSLIFNSMFYLNFYQVLSVYWALLASKFGNGVNSLSSFRRHQMETAVNKFKTSMRRWFAHSVQLVVKLFATEFCRC